MKKFLNSKYFDWIILTAVSVINIMLTICVYSTDLLPEWGGKSVWMTDKLENSRFILNYINTAAITAFLVGLALFVLSFLLLFLKNKKFAFFISIPYNIILNFVLLFVHIGLKIFNGGVVTCIVFSIIFSTAQLVYTIITHVRNKEVKAETPEEREIKIPLGYKKIFLICQILSAVFALSVFFIPVYTLVYDNGDTQSFLLIQALSFNFTDRPFPTALYVAFVVLFGAFFVSLIYLISNIQYLSKSDAVYVKKSKHYVYGNVVFLFVFFIIGYCICFINNLGGEEKLSNTATTVSYIPLLCSLVILVLFSVFQGKAGYTIDGDGSKAVKKFNIESLVYVVLLTCVTFCTLFLNIIEIHIGMMSYENKIALTGFQLLSDYGKLGQGFQTLSFVLFAILTVSGALFIFTLVSYLTKHKDYDKAVRITAIMNTVFVMLMGLSGIYFKIAQAINVENIKSVLDYYGIKIFDESAYTYVIQTKTIYLFIASFIILLVMLVRGQFGSEKLKNELSVVDVQSVSQPSLNSPVADGNASVYDFDACPAFTELDSKIQFFDDELSKRRASLFENLTLPNLIRFIVDYARECRLHLSYSLQDMANFVAGLGASRLTILQGMSGTGKTSLPKIFAEAIMGNCEIVEVESSWRDKNELLGYYNEFSKCFTPKKFTQCLYKAKLNPDVLTFIVLDEMNLSRIEYYFSDFLSLMEHEEDKREIKLLNVKLHRTENGERKEYAALTDGHTIKIPANVWFIGTANRDESTFEISDKVYDRAQTMNFNKRAPKIQSFSEPLVQRFVAYDKLTALFEKAKSSFSFDAESNAIIQKVEKILTPYNISFGNRILRQMEDFVKIYCVCFAGNDSVLKEAIEKILLSKVVCKLEYKIVENKEALAAEFDKLELPACSAFIRRLNED